LINSLTSRWLLIEYGDVNEPHVLRRDEEGRLLVYIIEYRGQLLTIANVYALAKAKVRIE
jgi:hypothetical protein